MNPRHKVTKKFVKNYYETAPLVLLPFPSWRIFKVQKFDGGWEIINNQIRSVEQLRKCLIKLTPLNVFQSTSCWLNPLRIEKGSYKIADKLFLNNLVFVDIDGHNIFSLKKVWGHNRATSQYV